MPGLFFSSCCLRCAVEKGLVRSWRGLYCFDYKHRIVLILCSNSSIYENEISKFRIPQVSVARRKEAEGTIEKRLFRVGYKKEIITS